MPYKDKEAQAQYQREYRRRNKEKIIAYRKAYYRENRERLLKKGKKYYDKNKDRVLEYHRVYYRLFKEKINGRVRDRMRNSTRARMIRNLRSRLTALVSGKKKKGHIVDLLGCPPEHLRKHLEVQFIKGMTWGNYGKVWHVDHKIPISAFDVENPAELRTCFHFSNLQPMLARANISKGSRICLES